MERAIIFTGKEETPKRIESYQLLIGCNYIYTSYDFSTERNLFFEKVSDDFARRIEEEVIPLEVGVFNGLRINPETGKNERIPKLEEELVEQLMERVSSKLMQTGRRIPVPSRN